MFQFEPTSPDAVNGCLGNRPPLFRLFALNEPGRHVSGYPTSMISPCQEGKSTRFGEARE
jgi:hypothetical protein